MLDKLDHRILWHLDNNARLSVAELARHAGVSRQTATYRLQKLTDSKVLVGFIAAIDIHRLGFLTYRVYYRFKSVEPDQQREVIDHLVSHPSTLWVVSTAGEWDIEVVFTARNFINFNNILKRFHVEFGKTFARWNISSSPVSYHFKRDYLIGAERAQFTPAFYGFEPRAEQWDKTDLGILETLSRDCRVSNEELAHSVGVAAPTLRTRLHRLEEERVIVGYRILLDLAKIERSYFKILLSFEWLSEKDEKKLYNLCAERNFVIYLTEVLGAWQMEIEAEIGDREELHSLVRDVRAGFPETIKHYEILEVTHEHKMNYFPMGKAGF